MIYRQGDVLLIKIEALPNDVSGVDLDNGRIVLAYGEVTGHAHAITVGAVPQARLWSADAERFLQALSTVSLCHEEHAPIELPAGVYQVVIQREYSPEEIRKVAD